MSVQWHPHNPTDLSQPTESENRDLPLIEPEDVGHKGGQVDKVDPDLNEQPISLVDYLWMHRDD